MQTYIPFLHLWDSKNSPALNPKWCIGIFDVVMRSAVICDAVMYPGPLRIHQTSNFQDLERLDSA